MTIYAGEYLRLAVQANTETAPGVTEPLTDGNTTSATIQVWDAADVEVLSEDLIYQSEDLWIYDWDTAGREPGRYKVRTTFTGPGNRKSWEYANVKLAKNKVEVAP